MFFYSEQVSLILSSSVSSINFGEVATNASGSSTFTLYAIDGKQTEVVTVTDNSAHFTFSPSSFNLSNGGNQLITVNFAPSITGSIQGVLTMTAAGGSVATVNLSGSGVASWSPVSASGGTVSTITV